MKNVNPLLVVLGPTASGKTKLSVRLAHMLNAGIISADSRQVYRDMDIGTGKDLDEYSFAGKKIPYYLIDILEAGEKYNIYRYSQDFAGAFSKVRESGLLPILCGGSGLYLEAALKGHPFSRIPENPSIRSRVENMGKEEALQVLGEYAEEYRAHADISSRKRILRAIEVADYLASGKKIPNGPNNIALSPILIGIEIDREQRRERITARLKKRLEEGMIEEVAGLLENGVSKEALVYYGLEYKWIVAYLCNEISYDQMFNSLNTGIHRFAKRQMTWFRKMEKDGWQIHWLPYTLSEAEKAARAVELLPQDWLSRT